MKIRNSYFLAIIALSLGFAGAAGAAGAARKPIIFVI